MYLSRLTLNPRSRRAQRELANPYELHRTLMRAFPAELPAGERVLHRVEVGAQDGPPTVLVQSLTPPDWSCLRDGDDSADRDARGYLLRAPESKEFAIDFAPGHILAFRLRANPTKKHRRTDGEGVERAVRDPIYQEDKQLEWLARKAQQGGFRILRVAVRPEGNEIAWQSARSGPRRKLTLYGVRFDGVLQVTDPDRMQETLRAGIGSAKGLGFGLLSLAPVGGAA